MVLFYCKNNYDQRVGLQLRVETDFDFNRDDDPVIRFKYQEFQNQISIGLT